MARFVYLCLCVTMCVFKQTYKCRLLLFNKVYERKKINTLERKLTSFRCWWEAENQCILGMLPCPESSDSAYYQETIISQWSSDLFCFQSSPKDMNLDFRETEKGTETERERKAGEKRHRERHPCERKTCFGCLSHTL